MLHNDLKRLVGDACYVSSGKLPDFSTHIREASLMLSIGICTSEPVFLRLWNEYCEFLVKRFIKR